MVASTEVMMTIWNGKFFHTWIASTPQPNSSFSMRTGLSRMPSQISTPLMTPWNAMVLTIRKAATSAGTNSGTFRIAPSNQAPAARRRRYKASG
ncbi:hypothetical protein D3C83_75810 [compost metagenome]